MAKAKSVKQKVTFSFKAPHAQSVSIAGDFTRWQHAPVGMKKNKNGIWTTTVSLAPGAYEYRLLVDDQWCDDPACSERKPNLFGGENCVCIVKIAASSGAAVRP